MSFAAIEPLRRSPRTSAEKPTGFYNEVNQAGERRRLESPTGYRGSQHGDDDEEGYEGGSIDRIEILPWPTRPFNQSYVADLQLIRPKPVPRPPRKMWPTPAVPITWPNDPNIPEDWTCEEHDLDTEYVFSFAG
jgi:hypothetical protein